MAASSTSNTYNSVNLWFDLKTLANARLGDKKYLLCLFKGKLSSSLFQIDSKEAQRNWGAWSSKIISRLSRTLSSSLRISDNDEENVVDYLEKLVKCIESTINDSIELTEDQVEILYEVTTYSFSSLADEYSFAKLADEYSLAKEEKSIGKGSGSIIEGFGETAIKLIALKKRIEAAAKQNSQFLEYQQRQKSLLYFDFIPTRPKKFVIL